MHKFDYLERQFYRDCLKHADGWWTLVCMVIAGLAVWLGCSWIGAAVQRQAAAVGWR